MRFADNPEHFSIREQFLSAHLQWLEQHQRSILVAGSVRSEMDASPVGGVWIVEAGSKAEVESLFLTDPFWLKGLRQSVEVLHWSKAHPNRKVPV